MKKTSVIGKLAVTMVVAFGTISPALADQRIEVTPVQHDFGDVQVGAMCTAAITISNFDGHLLEVYDIDFVAGSSSDFAVTTAPLLPVTIPSGSSVEVHIAFTPSCEGYSCASLEIGSDDPVNPIVTVALEGVGVASAPPPVTIEDTLAFFDASVADGTLVGSGPGDSAEKRLNALRNMLVAAGDLIDDGLNEEACEQLWAAYTKCDGQAIPPDFVAGPAVIELAGMIQEVIVSLGCG